MEGHREGMEEREKVGCREIHKGDGKKEEGKMD